MIDYKKLKDDLIKHMTSLNLDIHTDTKAKGNKGFFLQNRIDISRKNDDKQSAYVLIHEFAHYAHSKIETFSKKSTGSLSKLFKTNDTETIEKELANITYFIDKDSLLENLQKEKNKIKLQIKLLDKEIKTFYPDFERSKEFKEFNKYSKRSNIKFFMKYDRFKIKEGLWGKYRIYDIDKLKFDFEDIPRAFELYLYLKSEQRKQKRISARINKYRKYYLKPCELFARFIQAYFFKYEETFKIAPYTSSRFLELLECGHYNELKNLFNKFNICNYRQRNKDTIYAN